MAFSKLSLHSFLASLLLAPTLGIPLESRGNGPRLCGLNPLDWHAKSVWDRSIAGVIGDDFINKHGRDNWVQNLDSAIFGAGSDSWACQTLEGDCSLENECVDYNAHDKLGAYFLYYSVQQAHSFLNDFHEQLQDNNIKAGLSIDKIVSDFTGDDSDQNVDAVAMIGACLGMISGVAGGAPALSAVSGAFSGLAGIAANLPESEDPEGDFGVRLQTKVLNDFSRTKDQVETIMGALFGDPNYHQSQIPVEMLSQSFDNDIINAFGDGKWLIPNPGTDLADNFATIFKQMKQNLAWFMMRYAQRAFVLINTDCDADHCEELDGNAVWDPEHEVCFNLFYAYSEDGQFGSTKYGISDVDDDMGGLLWNEYGMSPLWTYRNSYDCWVNNGGSIGKVQINGDMGDDDLPDCFFPAIVVKGSYESDGGIVTLDDFPGQVEGHLIGGESILNQI